MPGMFRARGAARAVGTTIRRLISMSETCCMPLTTGPCKEPAVGHVPELRQNGNLTGWLCQRHFAEVNKRVEDLLDLEWKARGRPRPPRF